MHYFTYFTYFTSIIVAFEAAFTKAQLDCVGSIGCASTNVTIRDVQAVINAGVNDNRQYGDNIDIACVDHTCAFFQNTGITNNTGSLVKSLVQRLVDRGCIKCGSQFVNQLDSSQGELTVNVVANPACRDAVC
ncbi:killer kp4 [Moniliophthora roreri]|uniref:Killer toxin Kp4 domain-containing protein n=1 Tax=Moniliophthora roreri TaxID=221103 RepID=A0A0W0EU54_MONRR|nr:killer kp4 [Moniliophthora roreri]